MTEAHRRRVLKGEPKLLEWFQTNERFAGRYVRLGNGQELRLEAFIFPDGDYAYLAVPRDPELRRTFAEGILEGLET